MHQTPDPDVARRVIGAADAEVSVTAHVARPGSPVVGHDLTDLLDPDGSSVSYQADDRVAHTCTLQLHPDAYDLVRWGRDAVRLTMTVTSHEGAVTATLGTFDVGRPERSLTGDRLAVQGFSPVRRLLHPFGAEPAAETVPAGEDPWAAMRKIVASRGLELPRDGTTDAPPLTRPRAVTPGMDIIEVLDGLAGDAGLEPLWSGPDGAMRTAPVDTVGQLPTEWHYRVGDRHTSLLDVAETLDLDQIPNMVLYETSSPLSWAPRLGDGQAIRIDDNGGPTSLQQRGWPLWEIVQVDATNQTILERQATADWERRSKLTAEWRLATAPNPLHYRRDIVAVTAPTLGADRVRLEVIAYRLPLDGSPMDLTGRTL